MRQPANIASTVQQGRGPGELAADATKTDHLIAASRVGEGDRLVVFGYEILGHLAGLARHGVRSAAGVHAGYPYRPHEPVDVVWFTGVSDIAAEVTALIGCIGRPRLVAIELAAPAEPMQLRHALRRLAERGLDHTSYYKAPGLFIVTAWRAARRSVQGPNIPA